MSRRRTSRRSAARAALVCALLTCALAAAAGCGRRGNPRPPEDVLPQTITALEVREEPAGIVVAWPRPDLYTGGGKMSDLGAFIVERAVGEGTAEFTEHARIEVLDRDRFRQVRNFRFTDTGTSAGVHYRYRVVSTTTDGYVSAPSNEVGITRTGP